MEEINLNEVRIYLYYSITHVESSSFNFQYFEGIPANRTCPSESCPHISETDIEFRDHLWTHKEAEAGRPISNKERYSILLHSNSSLLIGLHFLDRTNALILSVKMRHSIVLS